MREIQNKKFSLFIGRWSPFHIGHDYIIRKALDAGKNVWIAIRNTPLSEFDPYSHEDRLTMLLSHFEKEVTEEQVVITVIPDIESVNIGRGVGYDIIEYDPPKHIKGISATKVRKMMDEGDKTWKEFVPPTIAEYLQNL